MIKIEAYHCEYCKKYSKSKGVMTRHEKQCYHNPVTKACATCKYLSQEDYSRPFFLGDGGEIIVTATRPICKKECVISSMNEGRDGAGHSVDLKHNCFLWEQQEREVDDED